MLKIAPITPVAHDLPRRWMSDDYFDLIVWYEPNGRLLGFQLCYDKPRRERALTWTLIGGFVYSRIDSGEQKPTADRTPILMPDGPFPAEIVRREFLVRAAALPDEIGGLVLSKIDEFAADPDSL